MSAQEKEKPRLKEFLPVSDSAFGHPKFVALGQRMKWNHVMARGMMEEFWHVVQLRLPDGVFTDIITPGVIIASLPWMTDRKAKAMVAALHELRFLDTDPDGVVRVHDWEKHGGVREATRRQRSEAGRASAERRNQPEAGEVDDDEPGDDPLPAGQREANEPVNEVPTEAPTKPQRDTQRNRNEPVNESPTAEQQRLEVRETTKETSSPPNPPPQTASSNAIEPLGEEEGKKRETAEARAVGAETPGDHAFKTAPEAAQPLPAPQPDAMPAPPPPNTWRAWKRLFPAELTTLRARTPEQLAAVAGALGESPGMLLAAMVDVAAREANGDRTKRSPMARIKALLQPDAGVSPVAVERVKGAVAEVARLDQAAAARERLRQAEAAEERAPPSFAVVLTCCDRCGDERKTDDTPDFRALLNNRKAKCLVSGCYGILEEIPEDTP